MRTRFSVLTASILSIAGLVVGATALPAQAASANHHHAATRTATVRSDIPAFPAYAVTNQASGRYLWYSTTSGKFETFGGTYTTLGVSSGASQEYYDVVSGNCLTFDSKNYVYELGCASKASQLWKSVLQSNGTWVVKNNYLGTSECLQEGAGNLDPVEMDTCVSGQANQQWVWTQLVGIMGTNR